MMQMIQRALTVALALSGLTAASWGQLYKQGDIVQEFTLTDRATGQPMRLSDFEGKIVFLDWFAWWCPFCQAAAPQLLDGIDRYYESRNGNPDGIPVVHVGVNLQSGQESQTQNFVDRAGLELVLEDFSRTVAGRFASGGQPIFAIINGVANSPSHQQWQLLYSQLGYGQTQFPVATFRTAIDAVKKPQASPVSLTLQPSGGTIPAGGSITLMVQATGAEPITYQWRKDGTDIPGATSSSFTIENGTPDDSGTYLVVARNSVNEVTSDPVEITVEPPPPAPVSIVAAMDLDGAFALQFAAQVQRAYRVEASEDLVEWDTVTNLVAASEMEVVQDSPPIELPRRFYRVVSE